MQYILVNLLNRVSNYYVLNHRNDDRWNHEVGGNPTKYYAFVHAYYAYYTSTMRLVARQKNGTNIVTSRSFPTQAYAM